MDNLTKHKNLTEMYKNNPEIINFISDFFNIRKGVRCIAFQDKVQNIYNRYSYYNRKSLRYVNSKNCLSLLTNNKTVGFFHEYIFDYIVTNNNIDHWIYDENSNKKDKIKILHNDKIIGSSIMLEIDSPKNGDDKINMFNKEIYDNIMNLKQYIEKKSYEIEMKCNCIFSGNGIYVVLESMYLDEEKITFEELRIIRKELIDDIQLFNKKEKPMIDDFDHGWANYFKIPFTYHETKNRMTIPISKGYINKQWLKKATNMNSKYCYSQKNIDDILKSIRWEKIW